MATLPTVEYRQRELNWFTDKYLGGTTPLIVDGKLGDATAKRIHMVRFYLGEGQGRKANWTAELRHRIQHMNDRRYPEAERYAGVRRRREQRRRWRILVAKSYVAGGVTRFDGVPVAAWFVPYLNWARHTGHGGEKWQGGLVSGYRTPAYSESLCYQMCGAPACSGMCAGRASHHSQRQRPEGAIDVSDYERFARIIAHAPYSPRIYNALSRDKVHFSSTGN